MLHHLNLFASLLIDLTVADREMKTGLQAYSKWHDCA